MKISENGGRRDEQTMRHSEYKIQYNRSITSLTPMIGLSTSAEAALVLRASILAIVTTPSDGCAMLVNTLLYML